MKIRSLITIIALLSLYGITIPIIHQIHSEQVYESILYLFNPVVELILIPIPLPYLASSGIFLNFNDLLILRIFLNLGLWVLAGIITFGSFKLVHLIKSENVQR